MQSSRTKSIAAPGVYLQNLQPSRLQFALARSDIAAFIGYARRGPCHFALRIQSWREFVSVFGEPLEIGHLAGAVKGFFENGGNTCYVVRIIDSKGQAARTYIATQEASSPYQYTISAAFNVSLLALAPEFANTQRALPDSSVLQNIPLGDVNTPLENKGVWGNKLSVSIFPKALVNTRIIETSEDGSTSVLGSIVGIEKYSVVRLSQSLVSKTGDTSLISHIVEIKSINQLAQSIEWNKPLNSSEYAFDISKAIEIESVEFDVSVDYENRQVEQFRSLSPHPEHSRGLSKTINSNSAFIQLLFSEESLDISAWSQADTWPIRTQSQILELGNDGLLDIQVDHYLQALALIAKVDEVSIVCAPDLVLPDTSPAEQAYIPPSTSTDCASLQAPKSGVIKGIVTNGEAPLTGVNVIELSSGKQFTTGQNGHFVFDDIDLSLRTLRLSKPGFALSEVQALAQETTQANQNIYEFAIFPIDQPRAFSELEILEVQQAMLNPAVLGVYKIALIDPPNKRTKIEAIRDWRSQLGDSDIGALAYPWLSVVHPTTDAKANISIPPCGHFAGLLANVDLQVGPHKSCANSKMRYAKGLTQSINEVHASLFTDEGITPIEAKGGQGIRILGARTLSSNPQWRYLPVRRLFFAIEKSLEIDLQWTVFESNTTFLRQAVLQSISAFLTRLWKQDALAGGSQQAAFLIKCDNDNNPQSVVDNGQLIIDIAIAPSVPFEYIKIRLGKTLDAIEVTDS